MGKCFRFLLLSHRSNYIALPSIAVILLAGCYLTGIPNTGDGLFAGYFLMFPSVLLMIGLFTSTTLTSTNLSMALSYGAKRTDYFKAMILLNLLNIGVFWLADCLLSLLPRLLGWACADTLDRVVVSWSFPFLMMLSSCAGSAIGELFYTHRVISGILTGILTFFCISSATFSNIPYGSPWLWGDVPWLLPVICLCLSGICLAWVHTKVMTAVVR